MSEGESVDVAIAPAVVQEALDVSASGREQLREWAGGLAADWDAVAARCGGFAPVGGGIDRLIAALAAMAATDTDVGETLAEVTAADVAPTGSPWFDPETDSIVVNLVRGTAGARFSVPFIERMAADLPEVLDTVGDPELTAPNQLVMLAREPGQFADNWDRAGGGAGDAVVEGGAGLVTLAAASMPWTDPAFGRLFDWRPREDTVDNFVDASQAAFDDPDGLAQAMVGWDQFVEDPYTWYGSIAPDLAFEAATTAVPASALGRIARVGEQLGDLAAGFPDLDTVRRGEGGWGPTDEIVSLRQEPFESPEDWIASINGDGFDAPGRNNNCVDCARAAEANWRGTDAVAAPLADPLSSGISADHLSSWSGGRFEHVTLDEVEARLDDLGPGSSALVTSAWDDGGAHAFNVVNDEGVIKWVDGQIGQVSVWPPPYADDIDLSIVIFIGPDGTPQ